MDFDFTLVLLGLLLLSTLFIVIDRLFLLKRRRLAIESYKQAAGNTVESTVIKALSKEPWWVELSKSLLPVFLIVFVLRAFLFEPFKIPSGSMLPTLEIGDFILVSKYEYGLRVPLFGQVIIPVNTPKRGDVLVFRYPEDRSKNFIKRVVGIGGDEVVYRQKRLWINGQEVPLRLDAVKTQQTLWTEELGGQHQIYTQNDWAMPDGAWIVPKGQYFVLGDNRDNSRDSRFWGFVSDRDILGRAIAIWMHKPSWVPEFSRNRWLKED
jgi:signal peptidase I